MKLCQKEAALDDTTKSYMKSNSTFKLNMTKIYKIPDVIGIYTW